MNSQIKMKIREITKFLLKKSKKYKFIPKDNLKSTISLIIKKYQKIYKWKNMNYYNDKNS